MDGRGARPLRWRSVLVSECTAVSILSTCKSSFWQLGVDNWHTHGWGMTCKASTLTEWQQVHALRPKICKFMGIMPAEMVFFLSNLEAIRWFNSWFLPCRVVPLFLLEFCCLGGHDVGYLFSTNERCLGNFVWMCQTFAKDQLFPKEIGNVTVQAACHCGLLCRKPSQMKMCLWLQGYYFVKGKVRPWPHWARRDAALRARFIVAPC